MDCEKFDKVALEMLYEELDELTEAAAKRHMDHCSRCGSVGARLRATREVGVLPMLTPPAGLVENVLRIERQARQALPIRQRFGRGISVLAGYAMRPQLAMAALLLLMIGSSFLFLRAKPGDADSILVTERGIREIDESVAIVPLAEVDEPEEEHASLPAAKPAKAPAAPAVASAAGPTDITGDTTLEADATKTTEADAYDAAMSAYRQGNYAKARTEFEAIAAAGGERAPSARLYAAHSARSSTGCAEAAPKFDSLFQQFPSTSVGHEAAWQAASCYRMLGQLELARSHYRRLLDAPAYVDRAQHALARLDQQQAAAVASRKAADETQSASKSAKPAAAPRTVKPASKKANPASNTKSGL